MSPRRSDTAGYAKALKMLESIAAVYGGGWMIVVVDWNCHIAQHRTTQAILQKLHMVVLATGEEHRLHKGWACVKSDMRESEVRYLPPLPDHLVVLAACAEDDNVDSDGDPQVDRLPCMRAWGRQGREVYGDVLEAPGAPLSQQQGMHYNREVTAAVEERIVLMKQKDNLYARLL